LILVASVFTQLQQQGLGLVATPSFSLDIFG